MKRTVFLLWLGVTFLVAGCVFPVVRVSRPNRSVTPTDIVTRNEPLDWQDGKIAFFSDRPALYQGKIASNRFIYLMNADGSEIVSIDGTFNRLESPLAWSPDGSSGLAVLYSEKEESFCIHLISAKSMNCLIKDGYAPSWSPDGSTFAYYVLGSRSFQPEQRTHPAIMIAVIGAEQTPQMVVQLPERETYSYTSWSHDGRYLAFMTHLQRTDQIWMYDFETQQSVYVTNGVLPVFSPISNTFAFVREDTIYLYDLETNQETVLDLPKEEVYWPAWSPDGTKLLFTSGDVYLYDFTSQQIDRLTHDPYSDEAPSWRP